MSGNFGDLLKKAGFEASEAAPDESVAPPEAEEVVRYAPKVVVRFQRKGHGGKTVTVVSGVVEGREKLARILRKQLGMGVRVDEETLILQGDQRERAARWLESQGVERVVRSPG